VKRYESMKFLPSELQNFFLELQAFYTVASFAKELNAKMNELPLNLVSNKDSYVKSLTLFGIVPQHLQGSVFFKTM